MTSLTANSPALEEPASLARARLERAIAAAVRRALAEPMQWGVDDCALWCASVLHEALGLDPAMRFRDRYTTRRGYIRVLKRAGFASLEDAIDEIARANGWRRIAPAEARTGDLGVVEVQAMKKRPIHLCVLKRGRFWVGRSDRGCGAPTESLIKTAWKVV